MMNRTVSYLAALLVLTCLVVNVCLAATGNPTKYYENGKRIPAPVNAPPVYPDKELRRRIAGTVLVAFRYDRDGKVLEASVKRSSGNQHLDAAALAAVRKWRFPPVLKDGQPQSGESETPVTFAP